MNKKLRKKLKVAKESLRALTPDESHTAQGGGLCSETVFSNRCPSVQGSCENSCAAVGTCYNDCTTAV